MLIRVCPRCGARLPTSALGGLCPRCVGRDLLGAEPAVQVPASGEKTSVEEQGPDPEDSTRTSLEVDAGGEMVLECLVKRSS